MGIDADALMGLAKSMHEMADKLETTAAGMKSQATEAKASSALQIEDVRAVLAAKSAEGHTAEILELLQEFGVTKLSAVKAEDYEALMNKAEVL